MAKKILIVEENVLMLDVMAYILMSNGYEVFALSDAGGVFYFIKNNHPDLVILDENLHGVDGTELCKLIKLNKTTSNLPIIICTGDRETCSGSRGAPDDVLEKP